MRADTLIEAPFGTPFRDEEAAPRRHHSLADWPSIVLDAYARQPTLSLTLSQGQRLWAMDAPTCARVLDGLVDSGALARTGDGQYCRRDYVGAVDPTGML